jgi:hypothetical protein
MARRTRREEDYQGPGAGRYPRRRSGNEALWIALGTAVVLGLVFLFFVMGSSGGDSEKREGMQALESFLKALLTDKYSETLSLMYLEGMLVEHNPGALKSRSEWTPQKRKELQADLYRDLKLRLKNDLRVESSSDIRAKVIDRAIAEWDDFRDEVKIRWSTEAYDKVIAERRLHVESAPWIATLSEVDGTWRVTSFRPER